MNGIPVTFFWRNEAVFATSSPLPVRPLGGLRLVRQLLHQLGGEVRGVHRVDQDLPVPGGLQDAEGAVEMVYRDLLSLAPPGGPAFQRPLHGLQTLDELLPELETDLGGCTPQLPQLFLNATKDA